MEATGSDAAAASVVAAVAVPENLTGLGRDDFAAIIASLGLPAWRAKQLWGWVYQRGVMNFAAMTDLPHDLRRQFSARYAMRRPEIARQLQSADGTVKWLLRFADGNEAETVLIPEPGRLTLCLSSQIGCTLNCRFCHTGTQKLVRNLTPAEIVGQVMIAREFVQAQTQEKVGADAATSAIEMSRVSNVVMMGMGEPLYNYDNVAKALGIVMDGEGIAISRRRITLSTAGVVPMMERCGTELGVRLAISLHAVTDELRDRIVPINRKYPIAELMAACRNYPETRNSRRITFEYVLLRDVNDSIADAKELVRLIRGIPAKINLIPFNPWPGAPFERSPDSAIEKFAAVVRKAGYPTPVRKPRGEDILAACGQLKSQSKRPPRARRS